MQNPQNPQTPEIKQTTRSSKSTDHKYAQFITQAQGKLQAFNPKYDKSIFDIKRDRSSSERPTKSPVAEVKGPGIGTSHIAGPADIFGRHKPLEMPDEVAAAAAAAAQQAALEELNKEENERKLSALISQMRKLEDKVKAIDSPEKDNLQKQITNIQSITNLKSIEGLPRLGLNQETLNSLAKKHSELMGEYDKLVKKIRDAAAAAERRQDNQEGEINELMQRKMARVRKHMEGSDHEEKEDLETQRQLDEFRKQYQQRIDELKESLKKKNDEKVKEKLNQVTQELEKAEKEFSELERYIEELAVVKRNGEVLQDVIDINYKIVNDYTRQIQDIDIEEKLNGLRENSDEMESAIQKRIQEINEKEYNIPRDAEQQQREKLKTCKNEYFVNIKKATVNLIKITIDKLKRDGINFKNNDIKKRIYIQIGKSTTKDRDLDCYLFLNIEDQKNYLKY